jgi:hypothetical protein
MYQTSQSVNILNGLGVIGACMPYFRVPQALSRALQPESDTKLGFILDNSTTIQSISGLTKKVDVFVLAHGAPVDCIEKLADLACPVVVDSPISKEIVQAIPSSIPEIILYETISNEIILSLPHGIKTVTFLNLDPSSFDSLKNLPSSVEVAKLPSNATIELISSLESQGIKVIISTDSYIEENIDFQASQYEAYVSSFSSLDLVELEGMMEPYEIDITWKKSRPSCNYGNQYGEVGPKMFDKKLNGTLEYPLLRCIHDREEGGESILKRKFEY